MKEKFLKEIFMRHFPGYEFENLMDSIINFSIIWNSTLIINNLFELY